MKKPIYFETKSFQFRENSGGRIAINAVALKLLGYRESLFMGECDGIMFISQEPFNGCHKLKFNANSNQMNMILIPIEICKSLNMDHSVEVDLYESNGDIFFRPVVE